jgi:hypothetical protein
VAATLATTSDHRRLIVRNRQDLVLFPGDGPCVHRRCRSGAGVAVLLQQAVEVAVLHARNEHADLGLAEDQRGTLRMPGVANRDLIA